MSPGLDELGAHLWPKELSLGSGEGKARPGLGPGFPGDSGMSQTVPGGEAELLPVLCSWVLSPAHSQQVLASPLGRDGAAFFQAQLQVLGGKR